MSNVLTESHHCYEAQTINEPSRYLAESLGSRILQLSAPEITLAKILDGEVNISEDNLVYTPYGARIDTQVLLHELEAK